MPKLQKAPNSPRLRKLLNLATKMILSSGYDALSIDSLISQVGGSKRNIYKYYKNKDEFFIQIVTDLCSEILDPVENFKMPETSPDKYLHTYGLKIIEAALKPKTLALHRLMIYEAKRFPDLSKTIYETGYQRAIIGLTEWITIQQKKKFLTSKISAKELSIQYISMLTGHIFLTAHVSRKSVLPSKYAANKFVQNTVKSFLLGNVVKKR